MGDNLDNNSEEKDLVVIVCENKKSKQKIVTIPKEHPIKAGQYVRITKV